MRARLLVALVVVAALGAEAPPVLGQVVAGQPVALGDVTLSAGTFSGDIDKIRTLDVGPRQFEPWVHMAIVDVTAGYYWTDHLKTEIEAAWTTDGEISGSGVVVLPNGQSGWVYDTSRYTASQFGVGQLWQFGRNATFHPWIGAGVDVVRVEHELDRPAQFIYVSGQPALSIPVAQSLLSARTTRVLPFASAGFKAYFNERGFVRSDLKLRVRDGMEQVVWKIGVGVDF